MNAPVWQGLMQQALVGTQRMDALDDAQWPVEWQALVRAASSTMADDAHAGSIQLLRAAGAVGLWRRAGHVPAAIVPPLALSPTPDDAQTAPTDEALIHALNAALREGPESLIRQSWHALARAGMRLPQQTLVAALEAAARSTALRADLLGVLGARGLWLARQNTAWKFAAGVDQQADLERLWSEGTLAQRLAVLHGERAADPQRARQRFEAAGQELNAKERLAMLEVLRTRLSRDDEALLESLLTDRSGDVRQLAAELLSALPQSAHTRRVVAWLAPLLKRDGDHWTIEPPEQANADWPRDGISIEVPNFFQGGERAWWLFQLTVMTPPAWWTETLGKTLEQVFAWADQTEWKAPLWSGLLEAAARAPGPAWLPVLTMTHAYLHTVDSGCCLLGARCLLGLRSLLAAMALPEREAYWQGRLKAAPEQVLDLLIDIGQLMAPDEHLSTAFSEALVAALKPLYAATLSAIESSADNRLLRYELSQALPSAALWLAPRSLPGLLADLDRASLLEAAAKTHDDVRQRVRAIAGIRQTLQTIAN